MRNYILLLLLFPSLLFGQLVRNEVDELINKTVLTSTNKMFCIGRTNICQLDSIGTVINSTPHLLKEQTTNIIESHDSMLIAIGLVDGSLFLKKYNLDLELVFSNMVPSKYPLINGHLPIAQSSDSTYIIAANINVDTNRLLLTEINNSGDTIWMKSFNNFPYSLNEITQTSSNEFVLFGNHIFGASFLLKFNKTGDVIRLVEFERGTVDYTSILKTSNGFILGGNISESGLKLILSKYNLDLDSLYSKTYFTNDHADKVLLSHHSAFDLIEVLVNNNVNSSSGFTYLQCNNVLDTLKSFYFDEFSINEYYLMSRYNGRLLVFGNGGFVPTNSFSFSPLNIDFPYIYNTIMCGLSVDIRANIYCLDTLSYDANWLLNEHIISMDGLEIKVMPDTTSYFVIGANSLNHNIFDSIKINVTEILIDLIAYNSEISCGDSSRLYCNILTNENKDSYNLIWHPSSFLSIGDYFDAYVKPDTTTNYYCEVSYKSCFAIDSTTVIYSAPNFEIDFSIDKNLLTSPPFAFQFENITPNKDSYSFYWDFGDNSIIENNNEIVFHEYDYNGEYSVKLSAINNLNGCSDSTLKPNLIYCTGGIDYTTNHSIGETHSLQFYPNPFKDYLLLKSESESVCNLISLDGSVKSTFNLGSSELYKLKTTSLPTGIYLLEVYSKSEKKTYTLVKNK